MVTAVAHVAGVFSGSAYDVLCGLVSSPARACQVESLVSRSSKNPLDQVQSSGSDGKSVLPPPPHVSLC